MTPAKPRPFRAYDPATTPLLPPDHRGRWDAKTFIAHVLPRTNRLWGFIDYDAEGRRVR